MMNHDEFANFNLNDILPAGDTMAVEMLPVEGFRETTDFKNISFDDLFNDYGQNSTQSVFDMSKDHIPVEQLSLTSPSHFLMRQPNAPETMFSSPSTEGISYEFVDLTVDNHRPDNGAQTITPPYNLSDRQLRHSNQSAGSYRGVPKSYAELITLAIESSPRRRLMLSDIYAWMYKNVPEFVDRRLPPSETSWKNSIRHNLSLHDKFIKEVNPASPKGSFWTMDKMDVTTCDSGFSTSFSSRRGSNSSRRGSGCNLAESIKQFQAIYNQSTEEVLPQVAQKLEQEQTRRCSISSSHKPKSNGGIFRKRSRTSPTSSSGTLFKDTRVLYQKRRRNTMCNDNSPKYEAIQNSVFVRNPPNGGYPVSSCQDVTKLQRQFLNVTDDQIMLDCCPTLVRLGIFKHLLG